MKISRSWLFVILTTAVSVGLIASGIDCWHAATDFDRGGIERIIEMDREYYRAMQAEWDKREAQDPEWVRPGTTTEETYERWRLQSRK